MKTYIPARMKYPNIFIEYESGTHEFTLAYLGSDNYNAAAKAANATIAQATVNLVIATENVTYPADVVVYVVADVTGDYNFTFASTTEVITLEAGIAKEFKYSVVSRV